MWLWERKSDSFAPLLIKADHNLGLKKHYIHRGVSEKVTGNKEGSV
jgi:hypothetical protein